ncbi:MAG TPA: serine hydrolase [Vicinamibacterales bacterium]|nr:serine hydrolase [Vicinamibacterales bacterium]
MRSHVPARIALAGALFLGLAACSAEPPPAPAAEEAPAESATDKLIARAKTFELDTPYVPPPGDALEHHTSGFAKIMCSAVFITGLDPEFAAENVGYFTSPYDERAKVGTPVIDREAREVRITLPNGVTRVARHVGDQGCVTLPVGADDVSFTPLPVPRNLPDAATTPWPMGDLLPSDPLPEGIDVARVQQAVDAAFEPADGLTAAFVVTWRGRLIGERYGEGITETTPLESWSMGKSVTSTLMGVLIQRGVYELWQPAPIPEWQEPGDPRAAIRIGDILQMSSGIRIRAPQDPDYDPSLGYPDHLYLYTGSVNSFTYAATRPQQWPPATVGRYRNSDPVLVNYLNRLGVEKLGEEYFTFPQRALFDKVGVRTMVMETDPFGNFLTQGYELASGRDWARLGNLYLQDGVWNGERILPEGYVDFVSTLAPAWEADGRPIYGGFFWINGTKTFPVPRAAYYMAGAGGQTTLIVPSHDLVVVRLGHYKGAQAGGQALRRALELLMEAIPERQP